MYAIRFSRIAICLSGGREAEFHLKEVEQSHFFISCNFLRTKKCVGSGSVYINYRISLEMYKPSPLIIVFWICNDLSCISDLNDEVHLKVETYYTLYRITTSLDFTLIKILLNFITCMHCTYLIYYQNFEFKIWNLYWYVEFEVHDIKSLRKLCDLHKTTIPKIL